MDPALLTLYHTTLTFNDPKEAMGNTVGTGEKASD